MTHYELTFKLQHDCPVTEFTKTYPTAVLGWWCDRDVDVLEVTCDDGNDVRRLAGPLDSLISRIGGKRVRKSVSASKVQIAAKCTCLLMPNSTSHIFERHNCLELYPAIFTGGWEWYRAIVFSERDLKGFLNDLDRRSTLEILSKRIVEDEAVRDTFVISTANLLGGLTKNQAEALLLALNSGYYTVPKRITTEAVAGRMGLPRTTFEERLRKAESKVMLSVAPYMHLSAAKRRRGRSRAVRVRERLSLEPEGFPQSELEAPYLRATGD